jgi:hypothetical protein
VVEVMGRDELTGTSGIPKAAPIVGRIAGVMFPLVSAR